MAQMMPSAPGAYVDVGGYRFHLQQQGRGRLAAILDSGLAGNPPTWANALPLLYTSTPACAVDRAGYAWSDPAPAGVARASAQIAQELRTALRQVGTAPPYVLLGHSAGAIHMLVYAGQYLAEVAGLVLGDPSHPEMFTRVPGVPSGPAAACSFRLIASLGRLGLLRWLGPVLLGQLLPDGARLLLREAWRALRAFSVRAQDYATAAREAALAAESSGQAHAATFRLGDCPLAVLTAEWWVKGPATPMKRAMVAVREELAARSAQGRHIIVTGCDHANLPGVRPEAVADSGRWILNGGLA